MPHIMREFSPYNSYMQSEEWKDRREAVLNERGWKCERCSARENIVVHHQFEFVERVKKKLTRYGRETNEDLAVLCVSCHDLIHAKMRKAVINRRKSRKKERAEYGSVMPKRYFSFPTYENQNSQKSEAGEEAQSSKSLDLEK